MKKEFMERFFEWQNYAHYLLLELILIWLMHLAGIHYFHSSLRAFGLLYLVIFIGDSIIHGIFWALPIPYQWRD